MEQGSYEDRRVYRLDLIERPPAEATETLNRYLAHSRVVTGEALETARQEHRSLHRRSQARTAIPEVWKELVGKGNEELVELLASNVELKNGIRPDTDAVAEFLAGLGGPVLPETVRRTTAERPTRVTERQVPQRSANETSRSGTLVLRGITYPYNSAKEAMVIVLRELAKTDPSFLERCSQHPDAQGRKRRYIARTPEELFPDREDLRDMNERLGDGWFVNTNLNNVLKKTIIKMATEVAGLKFGSDVTVEF